MIISINKGFISSTIIKENLKKNDSRNPLTNCWPPRWIRVHININVNCFNHKIKICNIIHGAQNETKFRLPPFA